MRLARRLLAAYRHNFHDHRRERLFLASLGFFVTFGIARLVTYGGRADWLPMLHINYRDTHVHHLVWGILLLLAVGYGWILLAGTDGKGLPHAAGRWLSLVYGAGAALTLDEFALWLNLKDVYWEKEGRASIDAVTLFGGLISVGLWGGPFLRAVGRQLVRLARLTRLHRGQAPS
ncbi:MAG: hypothetical protein ACRENJ_04795 [Candidatus Eiseniibacteriota bacterium]